MDGNSKKSLITSIELWHLFPEAIKKAWNSKLWKWIIGTSLSSTIAAIFLFEKINTFLGDVLGKVSKVSFWLIIGGLAIIFVLRVSGYYARLLVKLYVSRLNSPTAPDLNEELYGTAIILLKDSFALIHQLRNGKFDGGKQRRDDKSSEENNSLTVQDYGTILTDVCNNLKVFFDLKTNSKCSVALRLPSGNSKDLVGNIEILHLCRDEENVDTRRLADQSNRNLISENSAYHFAQQQTHALKQQMPYSAKVFPRQSYANSYYSIDALPYKSEQVYPIFPIHPLGEDKISGFIHIDSDVEYDYDCKYEKAILQMVSDGLHDILLA